MLSKNEDKEKNAASNNQENLEEEDDVYEEYDPGTPIPEDHIYEEIPYPWGVVKTRHNSSRNSSVYEDMESNDKKRNRKIKFYAPHGSNINTLATKMIFNEGSGENGNIFCADSPDEENDEYNTPQDCINIFYSTASNYLCDYKYIDPFNSEKEQQCSSTLSDITVNKSKTIVKN